MDYTVEPGLYALGNPGKDAPIFVTANYKMSFDRLRHSLPGRSGWILVLDTKGINVWCAAGKGAFGTTELVRRIEMSGLKDIVSSRDLILPQLAAPGVAAHRAKKLSGFRIVYGPILAKDLPSFLDAGMSASPGMRAKTFSFWERVVLIPVELVSALKGALILLLLLFILSGILGEGGFWSNGIAHALTFVPAVLGALFGGAVLTPVLLPWLPGRAFSVKGFLPGLAGAAFLFIFRWADMAGSVGGWIETTAWMILTVVLATYLSMNFTGASTYTSLSGVRKEMRRALPLQVVGAVIGIGLWLYSLLAF
jgi:acetyl-CoA decarbonylase/synthase complex subunit gamma